MHYNDTSSSRGQKATCNSYYRGQIMKYGQDVIIKNGQMYNIKNEYWY